MVDPTGSEVRFFVGTTDDLDQLDAHLGGFQAEIQQSKSRGANEHVVMVKAHARYGEDLLRRLGPNAQMLDTETEARRVWEAATVEPAGAPYEASGETTGPGQS